jgi:hypothetical protein
MADAKVTIEQLKERLLRKPGQPLPEVAKQKRAFWNKTTRTTLLGKTVTAVRYMTRKEADELGFYSIPVVVTFNDGTEIYPSRDDAGNGGGALFTNLGDLPVIR